MILFARAANVISVAVWFICMVYLESTFSVFHRLTFPYTETPFLYMEATQSTIEP